MEKKSEQILDLLMKVREQAKDAIVGLLAERKVTTINLQPYIQEGYITNYVFFDTDKNGNGECLELDLIEVEDDNINFTMYTNYGDYFKECEIGDFDTNELVYILEMLEEIFDLVDEGEPLLEKDEDFDDYEEDEESEDEENSREEESRERPWDYGK